MRTTILCLLLCLAASAAERPSGERREPASSGAVKTSPSETSARAKVPKDAVEVEPGTWRWTDQEGRKWLFRQTPFGIAKLEEGRKPRSSANDARLDAQLIESMKAVEKGDEIAFERPGPFGTYRWKRKKSELDEQEKAAWDRSRTKSPDSVKGRE